MAAQVDENRVCEVVSEREGRALPEVRAESGRAARSGSAWAERRTDPPSPASSARGMWEASADPGASRLTAPYSFPPVNQYSLVSFLPKGA